MLLIDALSGCYAHGLSDHISPQNSHRGVFVAPPSFLLGLDEISFVANTKIDQVYYELKRFVELLLINNPVMIEMLNMPSRCIKYRNGLFGLLRPELFLSKLCARSYTEYAQEKLRQIEVEAAPRAVRSTFHKKYFIDFCYVNTPEYSMPLSEWLSMTGVKPEHCGLTPLLHAKDIYQIFIDKKAGYNGIFQGTEREARLALSDIKPDTIPAALLVFDETEYNIYRRDYQEYQEYIHMRRSSKRKSHHEEYDAAGFMEIVRFLKMAVEIAREGTILTHRPDAQELLKIKSRGYTYSYLMGQVKDLMAEVLNTFRTSSLPLTPNREKVLAVLLEIREQFSRKQEGKKGIK